MFQQLASLGRLRPLHRLLQAPFTLHRQMLRARSTRVGAGGARRASRRASSLKMNALTDVPLIEALVARGRRPAPRST